MNSCIISTADGQGKTCLPYARFWHDWSCRSVSLFVRTFVSRGRTLPVNLSGIRRRKFVAAVQHQNDSVNVSSAEVYRRLVCRGGRMRFLPRLFEIQSSPLTPLMASSWRDNGFMGSRRTVHLARLEEQKVERKLRARERKLNKVAIKAQISFIRDLFDCRSKTDRERTAFDFKTNLKSNGFI